MNKLILIIVAFLAGCKLIPAEGQLDCGVDDDCPDHWLCADVDKKCYSSRDRFPKPAPPEERDSSDGDVDTAKSPLAEDDTEAEASFDSESSETDDSNIDTESNLEDSEGDDSDDPDAEFETDTQHVEDPCPEGSTDDCDDSDFCTVDDRCVDGACVGGQIITECLSGDNCCPEGCSPEEDRDCLNSFAFLPSNINDLIKSNWQTYLDAAVSGVVECSEEMLVLDSDLQSHWCNLEKPEHFPVVADKDKNIRYSIVPLASLTIEEGTVLRITGKYPVVFLVFGKVEIKGGIDVGAYGEVSGPGGDVSKECGTGETGNSTFSVGGGGGGGFGSAGAEGGSATGGSGGNVNGEENPYLVPLRGGCSGGKGTKPGGGAGGAIQISSSQSIHVYPSGFIAAQGGGGAGVSTNRGGGVGVTVTVGGGVGGGGGGSGGGVLLEAPDIVLDQGSWITANGGGGGAGSVNGEQQIQSGEDGHRKDGDRANGGKGNAQGGEGGAAEGFPGKGHAGTEKGFGSAGGGGGGYGRIVVKGTKSCTLNGDFSPPSETEAVNISCKF